MTLAGGFPSSPQSDGIALVDNGLLLMGLLSHLPFSCDLVLSVPPLASSTLPPQAQYRSRV